MLQILKYSICALGCILFTLPCFGQQTQEVSASGTPYLQFLPADYNSTTKKYPVLIVLHGTGERGTNLNQVLNTGVSKRIQQGSNMTFNAGGTGPEFSFIVMSPQITGSWNAGITNGLIDHAINNLRGDPARIYVTGFSLGGNGTWIYAINSRNQPSRVAAIAPIAGWGAAHLVCSAGNYSEYSVWAFHGDADATITLNRGQAMIDAYNGCVPAANPQAMFTIYPGVGHNSWDRAYTTDHSVQNPNLYEWLLTQKLGGSPSANAGTDVTLTLPVNSTTINGSGSDPGGSIVSYLWAKVTGPTVTLSNASTSNLSLSAMVAGVYEFSLTITDNDGNTATDNVLVTVNPVVVNQAPTIASNPPITLTLPTNSTNVVAVASDVDGTIATYAWIQKPGGPSTATLSGTTTATLITSSLIEGSYTFQLTVIDDDGATASRDFIIIVNPAAVNQPPTSNAGADVPINLPTSSTNLIGSGSDPDGSIASYAWIKVSGPTATLANTNTPTLSISSLVSGVYTFRLTVTDNLGLTDSDEATVTVVAANQAPTANAGSDFSITLPTSSTNVVGSGNDPDGTISSYQWSQISGPNSATLTNENSTTATISGLIQGNYSLSLTVTDNDGATGVDNVIVTVNAAPVNNAPTSNAGADKSITLPTNSIVLSGSGLDSDGTISTYSWTKVSGPTATLSGSNTATLTVNSMLAGSYLFRLTVTDNQGATGSDDVNVTVQPAAVNQSPIANAGSDVGVTLPGTSTILNGSGIDNDGTISTYLWTHISGPSATLSGQTTATLSISNLVTVGSYVFRLTVTDDLGATSFDEAIVTVSSANMAPIANAGLDQILTLPTNSTVINGLGSDSDGTITSYLWTIISGPAAAGLSNANTPDLTVSGLVEGTYILRLTVTDNDLSTGSDDIKVIVTATNMAPVANAGTDKTITLPTNSINIIGSGSDSDGTIVSYLWAKVSGPVAPITNSNSQTLSVADAIAGTYVFRLVVTDNLGLTDFDDMQLFVNSPAVNQPPVANAGGNKTITLPVSSTVLSGSGSDPDGTIFSYSWTKVSGPVVALTNENTSSLSLSTLVQGTYVFRLTVTDNGGLTATDDATVNVLPQIVNQIPIANAGVDKVLTLPTNSITLFGSGSDPDGSISSYMWSKQSGPASVLTNETTPNLSLSGLVEGAYVFQLAVTDNLSATSTDIVNITVNAMGVNQVPISNAGTNKTISLPTSSININGSGSDPDGSITSYQWSKISGPTATLSNDNQAILSLSDLLEGLYTFSLVVTDNDGATENDEMTVLVLSGATNQSPSVDAGVDITLVLPTNSVEINGFASDVDGTIVTYAWTKESGGSVT
ncbi:MAG: tandem-95 repeat protein, partial [Cyclobacteriaceae bacterium]